MNLYDDIEERAESATTLEDSAAVLSDLLTGDFSAWTDGTLLTVKRQIERVKGLKIHLYANDHAPPHFHVKGHDVDATFTIADCTYLVGNIDGRDVGLVQWWYRRSRQLLVDEWNSSRPSDCPVGKIVV